MNCKRHIARPAVIIDVNPTAQLCTIQYADRTETQPFTCPLPRPFASSGWGLLAMPTKGTRVLVDTTVGERPVIVGTLPMNQFASDFANVSLLSSVSVDQRPYPKLRPGEIAIQSSSGAKLGFYQGGSVRFDVNELRLEYKNGVAAESMNSRYVNTEAHREIVGTVKRDIREKPKASEATQDKLLQAEADSLWSEIGRNPTITPAELTVAFGGKDKTTRNPSLIEKRSLVYEFARTHAAEDHAAENQRLLDTDPSFLFQPNRRDNSRIDVFNLGPHLPNNLIEQIEGTAVDIYGNILDLNRHIIDFTDVALKDEHRIEHETTLLRRSIKYHLEMNSRKAGLAEGDPNNLDGHNFFDDSTSVGYSFSRWSVDVDGEGLTKINIPASSNTGNIPLLTRFVNQHDPNDRNAGDFRPTPADGSPARQDIQHIGFGHHGDGIAVPQEYAPVGIGNDENELNYHTTYHELGQTASEILQDDAVESLLDNNPLSLTPNAGGRSIHANLDGSLELNVGRDTIDRKSIVLDTSGSVISRIGKDLKGHSVVSQLDGDVAIQVGGDSVVGDDVATANSLKLYVKRGNDFHKIEFTNDGIFVTSAADSNLVLQSNNDLVLSAKGRLLANGELVSFYGTYDAAGNITNGERQLARGGDVVI